MGKPFKTCKQGSTFESSIAYFKFGTRYYNPAWGRWTQQDPIAGSLGSPDSANRYVYAQDDPVGLADSSGRAVNPIDLMAACLSSSAAVDLLAISAALGVVAAVCALTGVGCLAAVPALTWLSALFGVPTVTFCLSEAIGAAAVLFLKFVGVL